MKSLLIRNLRRRILQRINILTISRSRLFSERFYSAQNPDVVASGIDLATHYYLWGWREGRDPSEKFCTEYYLEKNADVAISGINPLLHYIKYGKKEGRQISSNLIVDAIRNSGLFDESYYALMFPKGGPQPVDLVRHYCELGWRIGLNPSYDFETFGYLESNHDVKKIGINPFYHYLIYGQYESRSATPLSRPVYENDVYFGQLKSDISVIANYTNPDWGKIQTKEYLFKGIVEKFIADDGLGCYSVLDHEILAKQAALARGHGVSTWCFRLDASHGSRCHDVINEFLSKSEVDIGIILDVDLTSPELDQGALTFLNKALNDLRYLKVDERPVIILTLPEDISKWDGRLDALNLILDEQITPYWIVRVDASLKQESGDYVKFKFDAFLDFPVSTISNDVLAWKRIHKSGVELIPYSMVVSQASRQMEINKRSGNPIYQLVARGAFDFVSRPDGVLCYFRCNLKEFRRWLDSAITYTRSTFPLGRRLLFVNAWNDWNLGAAVEPDGVSGFSSVNEISRALLNLPSGIKLPKVSVVVPNYNHAKYLRRRLDSIYRQTYTNIEVILLDDCSVDDSIKLLSEYADLYPDITTTIFNASNSGGVFYQWANGIKAATGDLIWVAESDDYCEENFLEKLVCFFEDDAMMLAYSKTEFVRDDESIISNEFWNHVRDLECREKWRHSYVNTAHREILEGLGVINTIPNVSAAIFRRPIDMALLNDPVWLSMRVVGDWVFYLHQLRGGRIAYSAETTTYFRRHKESTAAGYYKKDIFYKELRIAGQTVQALYDTPSFIVDKFYNKVKESYDHHVGGAEESLKALCNKKEILEASRTRTPNIIVSTMGFYPGGAEVLPIVIANSLKRLGHSVLLLSAKHGATEDRVRRLLRSDIPLIETSDIEETKCLIEDFGVEVLNSHQWHIQQYTLSNSDVFSGLKSHVASLHGMIENRNAFSINSEQLNIVNRGVSTWVYTADKNLELFVEFGLYNEDPSKFIKLPNGLPPPLIKPVGRGDMGIPDDAFVLCCVSRAIREKGWSEAIEAVSLARKIINKDIHLILVGNGLVYEEYCESGVPSFVHLVGFNENSVGYYALSDMGIMLTTFKSESFPLTIIDCLFSGRPFIATAIGEIRNMLTTTQGMAGDVIELQNWEVPVAQVAHLIASYASNMDALISFEGAVLEAANRYKIDAVVEQYVSIFDSDIEDWHRNNRPA